MRILIIEDEVKITSFVKRRLKEEKFVVDVALNGEEGLYFAKEIPYDLILLDIMLPDKDGIAICKELRGNKINTPVLMLTARNAVHDRIAGLNVGADDYLSKPFALDELVARVHALLRRERTQKSTRLRVADLEMDILAREVRRGSKKIPLTAKEYMLLEYFMLHANQVVTRTMISDHVWDENHDYFTNVIDVYINYLRNKVDKDFKRKLIHTVRGIGYVIKGQA